MFTRAFWKDTVERVVASAAGGALTALGLDVVNVLDTDWKVVVGSAAGTGLVSLLKALVARNVNDPQSASLIDLPGRHAAPEA
jgi:tetrahydromethanopterin S-methyltransferase subunit C